MRVRIKLRDMGVKKQPKVWLIVQPAKKNLKGKYLDRIGVVHPQVRKTVKRHIAMNTHRVNYWLSVGATPTRGAHRMLSRFGLLPPLPSKFGSIHAYERPEKQYETTHFYGHGKTKFTANHVALHYKQKLQEQMNLIERKRRLAAEAMATVGGAQAESAIDNDAEDTDDIDSDDPDIFERSKKFQKVLKKFNKHKEDKMLALKGNDLRYNVYLKKLQKLSRKDLGLDIAAYRDYVNNLKEFAHINKDLNIFAAENLIIDSDLDERGILQIKQTSPTHPDIQIHLEGRERVEANQKSIHLTLAKFLRKNSGFISARDKKAVKELTENLKLYLVNDPLMCDQLHRVYNRRKKEQNEMSKHTLMVEELLGDVPMDVLERTNVSQKEFKEIQMLVRFDKNIFAPESNIHLPNDLLVDNPYNSFVDFERLPNKIPEKVKQLLYRPEKMARLRQAYHKVAIELKNDYQKRVNEKKEWERNKHIRLDWHHRQPAKTAEEYALIDSICKTIEKDLQISSEEGLREIDDMLTVTKPPIEQFTDIRDWYKPLLTRLLEERRKTPKEQRLAMFRNDSIDEVDTTDLENWSFRGLQLTDSRLWKDEDIVPSQKTQIDRLNDKMRREEKLRKNVIQRLVRKRRFQDDEKQLEADLQLSRMSPEERRVHKKKKIYDILRDEQERFRVADSDSDFEHSESDFEEQNESDPFMQEGDQARKEDVMDDRLKFDNNFKKVYPGFDDDPKNKFFFEHDLAKEYKRIFTRHRIDIAKMYFEKDGGYNLRELKRIYKIEMEENPERYTLQLDEDKEALKAKEAKQKEAYNSAVAQGPIFDMPEDRTAEIAELREKLDLYIPKIKAKIQGSENYKDDLEYQKLISEMQFLEDTLEEKLSLDNPTIDEKSRGEAAKFQASIERETPPLLPIHLRYMARQLTQILHFRKHEPTIDLIGEQKLGNDKKQAKDTAVTLDVTTSETLEDPAAEGKTVSRGEKEKEARKQKQKRGQSDQIHKIPQLNESALDILLGEKVVSRVNDADANDADLDLSEFTIRDAEIEAQVEGMSDDYIKSQINKLKDEADKLEKKLATMSLRERAQWDKHYPFSIKDYDNNNFLLREEYQTKKILNKLIADNPTVELNEDVKKMARIDPELEQWFQTQNEKEEKIMRTMAKEMVEDGTLTIEQEELEKILEEISNKDGLDSQELADKYFEEMWTKMKKVMTNKPLKPQYLNQKEPDIYKNVLEKENEYQSIEVDEFILDQENYDKWHMYQQEKIGRYPHGYRHFENFANYSQVKKDATIQEYMERVNRPCEFHEYLAIMRQHLLEQASTPEFQHRWKADIIAELHKKMKIRPQDGDKPLDIDVSDNIDHLQLIDSDSPIYNVQTFVTSDYFIAETRKIFSKKVQGALVDKRHFMLVEALEETIDFWSVGKYMFHIPLANTYIPVRNTIMKKPNLLDEDVESDELGYMFNNYDKKDTTRKRLHAMEQLSPLRSNRMGPGQRHLTDSLSNKDSSKIKTFFRWRGLSKVKSNNFSTMTRAYTPLMQDSMVRPSMFGVSLPSRFLNFFRQE